MTTLCSAIDLSRPSVSLNFPFQQFSPQNFSILRRGTLRARNKSKEEVKKKEEAKRLLITRWRGAVIIFVRCVRFTSSLMSRDNGHYYLNEAPVS